MYRVQIAFFISQDGPSGGLGRAGAAGDRKGLSKANNTVDITSDSDHSEEDDDSPIGGAGGGGSKTAGGRGGRGGSRQKSKGRRSKTPTGITGLEPDLWPKVYCLDIDYLLTAEAAVRQGSCHRLISA